MTTENEIDSPKADLTRDQAILCAEIGDEFQLPKGPLYRVASKIFKTQPGSDGSHEVSTLIVLERENSETIELASSIELRGALALALMQTGDTVIPPIGASKVNGKYFTLHPGGLFGVSMLLGLGTGETGETGAHPTSIKPPSPNPEKTITKHEAITHSRLGTHFVLDSPDIVYTTSSRILRRYDHTNPPIWSFEITCNAQGHDPYEAGTPILQYNDIIPYAKKGDTLFLGLNPTPYRLTHKQFILNSPNLYAVLLSYEAA
ncbi:hypothetical protein [Pseudomonas sp. MPC6]|jgi:hypothetical protein|uniref:hypothetical protein n=1 Tax=unclassified Pseudomonas TaxID=196821 RepID=UPI0011106CB3|nr:hypothetical protein [Pseudomonas sp. MPC6]QCY10141.1 hypothetical protein ELQ88_04670 [Pseudomonas sp. MPC6]